MGRVSDRAQKRVQEENRGCQKGIPKSISSVPSEFSVQGYGRRSTPAAAVLPTAAASANVFTTPTAPTAFRPAASAAAAEQPSGESFATVAPAWPTGSPSEPPHADAGPGRSDATAVQQLSAAVRLTVQITTADHDANATTSSTSQSTTDASGPSSTSATSPPHADEPNDRPAATANDGPTAAATTATADGNVAATTNAAKPPYQCKHERNDEHGHDTTAITLHESTDVTQSATRTTAPSASWSSDAAAAAAAGWTHEPPPGCSSTVRQPTAAERHSPAMYPARLSEPGDRQFRLGG